MVVAYNSLGSVMLLLCLFFYNSGPRFPGFFILPPPPKGALIKKYDTMRTDFKELKYFKSSL